MKMSYNNITSTNKMWLNKLPNAVTFSAETKLNKDNAIYSIIHAIIL